MPPVSLWLYNLGMVAVLCLGWPVIVVWLLLVPKHRAGWRQKLGLYSTTIQQWLNNTPTGNDKRVWVHAVSVGEFNAIRAVVIALVKQGHQVVITTTTKTGQGLAKQVFEKASQVQVLYCPWDIRWAVQRAVSNISPDVVLIAETELWPNLIDVASARCPVLLINARLSEKSYKGYRWLRWWVAPMLQQLVGILAQSEGDAERYQSLGARSVTVMGNLKLDMGDVASGTKDEHALAEALALPVRLPDDKPNIAKPVVVLASTHPGEEALFFPWLEEFFKAYPKGRCIIAPRHPERAEAVVAELSHTFPAEWITRRSCGASPNTPVGTPLVVLDTIGELVVAYALADAAIIGGSFTPKRGGQNPLEAIGQNIPVVYGPYMANFRPIVALLQAGNAAVQVSNAQQAGQTLFAWLEDADSYRQQVSLGKALLAKHQGVTRQLLERLAPYLSAT